MNWEQFLTIILTALTSAFLSNYFAYFKDNKLRSETTSVKYLEAQLIKVYAPIYKVVSREIYSPKGYTGLSHSAMTEIKEIADEYPEYCTDELEILIGTLYDDSFHRNGMFQAGHMEHEQRVDNDQKFFNHVSERYRKYKKILGNIPDIRKNK
ncbi:hypothetical protein ACR80L_09535 [Bacillus velezensis]|uniref:hypothetical protein n=1 Tax=Bacillus velezensis TaxID=492670 RepID=UPI00052A41AB|nr:hypothetical protein [Bacillus velezensis]AIU77434.1 hypothetical protein MA22_13230 [Bacillus subtilis]AOO61811.1 hypothetical protein BBJ33_09770 [Bacillus velezensis]NGM58522.1 hypothetical protein [Bacillus velezensis]